MTPRYRPIFALLVLLVLATAVRAAGQTTDEYRPRSAAAASTPQNVHEKVSSLSDEQVRHLLIEELQKTRTYSEDRVSGASARGFFSAMLERLEHLSNIFYWRLSALQHNYLKVPYDMGQAVRFLSDGEGFVTFFRMIAIVALILAIGYGIERVIGRLTSLKKSLSRPVSPPEGVYKFWGALMKALPDFFGIVFFTVSCFAIFIMVYGPDHTGARPIFLASLLTIVMARLVTTLSKMVLSPSTPALRLIPFDDPSAEYVHRQIAHFAWIILLAYMVVLLFRYAGLRGDSFILLIIACGTGVILLAMAMILQQRAPVAMKIRGCTADSCTGTGWFMDLFAATWHLLAIGYLFAVWFLWSARLIILGPQVEGAFIVSLLIVPIYLLLDSAANWVIDAVLGSLRKQDRLEEPQLKADAVKSSTSGEDSMRRIMRRIVRAVIIFMLLIWMLNLWGFDIPFSEPMAKTAFEIFFTLVAAYFIWRMINGFIGRKLEAAQPGTEENDEESEWGSAATQDRTHTLLPILRKFIATFMVVMVTLIVLSAMGVNIGPLLAGAGVAGLAIGFGAQKLVADVLSGIFNLVDDAFRVGEYIEAGNVSGVVEAITLRNVMLRHHRGMLQIIPYSDLGPVTNFMRGGIVVKFNLQFPYDTDIDKVRKVIKKVGKKMLEDPEIGKNFIKQLKSQGVREVGDSIMTIRVKFTAEPGTHFVIRREAYKRITEALEAKGIQYAHRKVIVEVASPGSAATPDGNPLQETTGYDKQKLAEGSTVQRAAAAAAERVLDGRRIKPDPDF